MKKKEGDEASSATVSFLDIIACAFGAIVLLVLILPIEELGILADSDPTSIDYAQLVLDKETLDNEIEALTREITENQQLLAQLGASSAQEEQRTTTYRNTITATTHELNRLRSRTNDTKAAIQKMKTEKLDSIVEKDYAGIPVDSEYVAFVIDTSGSMKDIWSHVMHEVNGVLSLYPKMKGFQILSDEGKYLYRAQTKRWVPDTPQARRHALYRLRTWRARSNSSPATGIKTALRDLYDPNKKIAIFVFGDDFASNEDIDQYIQDLQNSVASANVEADSLRIHAIGFENHDGSVWSALRFSVLMRELTQRNGGAFLALPMFESRLAVTKSAPG